MSLIKSSFVAALLFGLFGIFCPSQGWSGQCNYDEWTFRPTLASETLRGAAYGNGRFVVVGDQGLLLTSSEGEHWQVQAASSSIYFTSVDFWSDRFFAVGRTSTGPFDSSEAILWTSPDGLVWAPRFKETNTVVFGTSFGNGVFVAVCGAYSTGTVANVSQALTSSDGVEWTRREIGPGWLYDVAFGNGVFVAAGGYRLFRSIDGVNWQPANVPGSGSLQSVTFSGSIFVTVGEGGRVATSPDGVNWTARNAGVSASLTAVASSGDAIVAAGNGGVILTSNDGASWTQWFVGSADIRGLVFGSDSFLAVGRYGTILQSCAKPVTRLSIRIGSPVQISLQGIVGTGYRLEFNDVGPVGEWQTLQIISSLPSTPFTIDDPAPSPTGHRFYRAVLLP